MQARFYIAGAQFHDLPKVVGEMSLDDRLKLVPEPTNKFDPYAVRIERGDTFLGYIPKTHSGLVSAALKEGKELTCTVTELNPEAKPWLMCFVLVEEVEPHA